jgi:hypothetical protein
VGQAQLADVLVEADATARFSRSSQRMLSELRQQPVYEVAWG